VKFNFTCKGSLLMTMLFMTSFGSLYSQKPGGEDGRIDVTIDSLQRVGTFPESLRLSGYSYGSPGAGKDFAFIYFKLIQKIDLGVSAGELRFAGTYLVDNNGREYKAHAESYTNSNLAFSDSIRNGYTYFSIPVNANPIRLVYNYQYRVESSGRIQIGQLSIDLLQPKSREQLILINAAANPSNAQTNPSNSQLTDSIIFIDRAYFQRDVQLKRSAIKEITMIFPEAYYEVKSGNSRITWGYILAGFGGISLGGGLSTLIFGETSESLDPATGIGVGVACIAGSYLLVKSGAKKLDKGVTIYNSHLVPGSSQQGVFINFGLANHGIGFTATF